MQGLVDAEGRGVDEGEGAAGWLALLPRSARRLLLVGDWPEPALAAVRTAGLEPVTGEGKPGETFDAVLWRCDAAAEVGRRARGLRDRLEDAGTLVVAGREAGAPEVVRALSESGFVLRRETELDGPVEGVAVAARRDPFVVRPYRPGDEAAIAALFRRSFHQERSLEDWRWKYEDAPWGGHRISVAVSPEGRLAAHYAGYPVPFLRAEGGSRDRLTALHVGDTMTDPEVRHRGHGRTGLLARTVRHYYATFCTGRVAFNFGFNTGKVQRFSRRLAGARLVEPVACWSRELGAQPLRGPGGFRVRQVERCGAGWDRFLRRAAPHYGVLVERNARYLTWRYLVRPDVRYRFLAARRFGRLAGWSVFRRLGARIVWGDALFTPRTATAAAALLAAALAAPELAGAERIEAWFPERPRWWVRQLERMGFVRVPEPEDLGLVCVPHLDERAGERLRSLYYTRGDGDLF